MEPTAGSGQSFTLGLCECLPSWVMLPLPAAAHASRWAATSNARAMKSGALEFSRTGSACSTTYQSKLVRSITMGVSMSFKRIAPVEFVTLLKLAYEESDSPTIATTIESLPVCELDKEWATLQNMLASPKHFSFDLNAILFNEAEMISELSDYIQSYYITPSDVKRVYRALSDVTMAMWLDRFRSVISRRSNEDFSEEDGREFFQTMSYIGDFFMFLHTAVSHDEGIIRVDDI